MLWFPLSNSIRVDGHNLIPGCAIWNCAYKDLLSSSCETVTSPVSDQVRTVSWLLGENEHDIRKPMTLGVWTILYPLIHVWSSSCAYSLYPLALVAFIYISSLSWLSSIRLCLQVVAHVFAFLCFVTHILTSLVTSRFESSGNQNLGILGYISSRPFSQLATILYRPTVAQPLVASDSDSFLTTSFLPRCRIWHAQISCK